VQTSQAESQGSNTVFTRARRTRVYDRLVKLAIAIALAGCAPLASASEPAAPPSEPAHASRAEPPRYALADATAPEHALFGAINAARVAEGAPALAWSEQVSFIAHHATSAQLDLGELSLADINVDIAVADDVDTAARAWLADPHRRAQLLAAGATDVGIGVTTTGDGRVSATAVTFRMPPVIDAGAFARHVEAKLESRDRKLDPDLRSIAQTVAADLAAGWTRSDVEPLIQSRLRGIDRRWTKIRNSMTRLVDVSKLERDDQLVAALLHGERADDLGVGVAQGAHRDSGDGAIWLVVLYAEAPDEALAKPFGGYMFDPHPM